MSALALATALELNWPWGLFFIGFTIPTLRAGETYLFDTVLRERNPIVFWTIGAFWLSLGLSLIAIDVP